VSSSTALAANVAAPTGSRQCRASRSDGRRDFQKWANANAQHQSEQKPFTAMMVVLPALSDIKPQMKIMSDIVASV
jgi:hypothetical protein